MSNPLGKRYISLAFDTEQMQADCMGPPTSPSPSSEGIYWKDKAAAAARNLPEGRIGGVVAQLRQRGRLATLRANVFLCVLILTVVIGLGYYILLPLLRAYADGSIRTWQDQVAAAESDGNALDTRRGETVQALAEALSLSPGIVREQPDESLLQSPLVLAPNIIVVTTRSGAILRSTDGARTWSEVFPPNGRGFSSVKRLSNGSLLAVGNDGSLARSLDSGASWASVRQAGDEALRGAVELGQGVVLTVGPRGTILRSADSGENWVEVLPETGTTATLLTLNEGTAISVPLYQGWMLRSDNFGETWEPVLDINQAIKGMLQISDTEIMAVDDIGTIMVSRDEGVSWSLVREADGHGLFTPLALDSGILIAFGPSSPILRSTDRGATWTEVLAVTGDTIQPNAMSSDSLVVLVGRNGLILRSEDAGLTWSQVRSRMGDKSEGFFAPIKVGARDLLATGGGGTIIKSEDAGETWSVVRQFSDETIRPPEVFPEGTVIATGDDGTILLSDDGGAEWLEVAARSADGESFGNPALLEAGVFVATGSRGTILRLSSESQQRLEALASDLSPGRVGDEVLKKFIESLPSIVQHTAAVSDVLQNLDRIATERVLVDSMLARATDRLAAWRSGAAASEVRLAAFAAFMESCRAGASEPANADLSTACLQAYTASEGNTERQWWQAVAEQAPQGILLLFLLATLSGLYRYNLRLAGFHNGRADALELMVAQVDKDLLTPVADALAADKVEFGAAKTPTDHAAEMATALINRAKS